ncbi:indolepyruvate/phenylpyruvate decarboxylase [Massilia eurypsychrophila]|uniref:Indolepyruvate/phenylpyruvate decarboxylase n=1 Tax=Massilia eurypsychrophila TaxID=1485217 RepID=A0A2G8TCJ5_9BURK|nr:indolepyruvate/phenylpyruvate decarboxylase [Massilia eurypsychrophila]PIL43752.1 indolepyruvate/phenylpyruvate decarboxylase [Massilia eurypsychrophila]
MNLSQALLHALHQHGAREIFGIPGDFILAFFRQVETTAILPMFTLSHEPGVGFAADAAARYHTRLGVAAVTYGAGALNMVNAVASSYAEKVPLVVISGAPGAAERRSGYLLHHQAKTLDSQLAIFREITCDQVVLDDAARAPADIARVLASCLAHSRPVYIELPRDMVLMPCAPVPHLAPPAAQPRALAACTEAILARLAQARAPLLLVGVEIRRYGIEHKVARLAQLLNIPVATTFMGRGLLADTDVALLGTYLGVAGPAALSAAVEQSDALFMLGVIVSDTNFGASGKTIDLHASIHAHDGAVSMGYQVYPAIPLEALVDALLEHGQRIGTQASALAPPAYPHDLPRDAAPIAPRDIARAVNDVLAAHPGLPLAADIGDCLFTALDIAHTALVAPGYYATMGYGVPAGLGLQAGGAGRPVILVGDGAFQMTGWELGNCQRYGWDPIVIVFNNCSWEMLRAFEPGAGFTDLSDWHFADMAAALGGNGCRVTTRAGLGAALDAALARRGRFELIEVMIPRGVVSDTLERFVKGVRRLQQSIPAPLALARSRELEPVL